jgi:uncharacterized protein (TIGR02145 family)
MPRTIGIISETPDITPQTLTDARDGKTYRTVTINGKRWTAENMGYATPESSWCYQNDTANCDIYGRLYTWNAATAACPSGWHLPSGREWDDLILATGGKKPTDKENSIDWYGAGKNLRAKRGWGLYDREYSGKNGYGYSDMPESWGYYDRKDGGTDDYGFSALPGGYRDTHRGLIPAEFQNIGWQGYWWTASENENDGGFGFHIRSCYSSSLYEEDTGGSRCEKDTGGYYNLISYDGEFAEAYIRSIYGDFVSESSHSQSKGNGYSVRCVQDSGDGKPSRKKSATEKKKEGKQRQKEAKERIKKISVYFTDSRDGQKYRAVEIDSTVWMAQNLNYKTVGSWCYENADSNCVKYGRLYNWKAAQTACPNDWELPSSKKWDRLTRAIDGKKIAGKALKAASGWNAYRGESGDGTDAYGFSALPGGSRFTDGAFGDAGDRGHWWTADNRLNLRHIFHGGDYVGEDSPDTSRGFSVRCVRRRGDGGGGKALIIHETIGGGKRIFIQQTILK